MADKLGSSSTSETSCTLMAVGLAGMLALLGEPLLCRPGTEAKGKEDAPDRDCGFEVNSDGSEGAPDSCCISIASWYILSSLAACAESAKCGGGGNEVDDGSRTIMLTAGPVFNGPGGGAWGAEPGLLAGIAGAPLWLLRPEGAVTAANAPPLLLLRCEPVPAGVPPWQFRAEPVAGGGAQLALFRAEGGLSIGLL